MAHWFHRNPLKATAPQDFNLKMVSHDVEAIKVRRGICSWSPLTYLELSRKLAIHFRVHAMRLKPSLSGLQDGYLSPTLCSSHRPWLLGKFPTACQACDSCCWVHHRIIFYVAALYCRMEEKEIAAMHLSSYSYFISLFSSSTSKSLHKIDTAVNIRVRIS